MRAVLSHECVGGEWAARSQAYARGVEVLRTYEISAMAGRIAKDVCRARQGGPPPRKGPAVAENTADANASEESEAIDEKEIRGRPEAGGNGALRAGGEDDFENFGVAGELVEKRAAGGRRIGVDHGKLAQGVVDDFTGRSHGSRKTIGAKLHHGMNFMEMPGNTRGERNGALETFGVLRVGKPAEVGAGRANERIEHEQDATLVLARELADHQAAGLRGHFPVHEAGAIGVQVIAQGMKLVAASAEMAGHFPGQQGQ